MIDLWMAVPRWLKYALSLILLGISTLMYFNDVFWPYGWGMGAVLLLATMSISDD